MANNKVLQEFEFNFKFNDKDASKSIKAISNDMKKLSAEATVLTTFVEYVKKVDAALSDFKTNNKDMFNQMFGSLDTELTGALSDSFGILNSDMTGIDKLKQKIQDAADAGSSKTKLETLRNIAEEINALYEKIGAQKPIDIEEKFFKKGSKAEGTDFASRIKILNDAINGFAINFKDVQQKLKDGFTVGGAGGSGGGTGLEDQIKLFEQQIEEYKRLIDVFKQLKEVKDSIDNDGGIIPDEFVTDYDVESIKKLIKIYKNAMNEMNQLKDSGDTSSTKYYNALATSIKSAISLKDVEANMDDELLDQLREVKISKEGTLEDAFGNLIDNIDDFFAGELNQIFADLPNSLAKAIEDAQSKIASLKKKPSGNGSSPEGSSGDADKEAEAYGRLQQAIENVKAAVEDKTRAFRDEATTVDTVVNQEIESLTRLKEHLQLIQNIIQEVFYGKKPNIAFHAGNLDYYAKTGLKSERLGGSGTALIDGYGAYGTGIYTVSNPNAYLKNKENWENGNGKIYAVDLSKYNMFTAQTSEQAEQLYDFLSKLEKFVLTSSGFKGFEDQLDGINIDSLYAEMQNVFKNTAMPMERLQKFIGDMKQLIAKMGIDKLDEIKASDLDILNSGDNVSTQFMRMLGYQGVNVKGTRSDSTAIGSVIYDLDQSSPYVKVFDNLNEAIAYYNQNLSQAGSIQTTFSGTVQALTEGLEQVCQTIQNMPTAIGEFSNALQPIMQALPDMLSNANDLKDAINNLGKDIDQDGLQSIVDKLSSMKQSAEDLKESLSSLGDNFGTQGDSALNVKFGDTLKVDLTSDSTGLLNSIQDAIVAIQTKINAQGTDDRQTKVDTMKNNLTQLLKYISDFNNKKKPDGNYQGQEISAAILSDGSIATGFGEDGSVPWNRMASALVANLTKTLLVDLHSHPLEQLFDGSTYVSDFFSGSNGDLSAFKFAKQLGAQLASMLTGNIMRVLDLSKLTNEQMTLFRMKLADIEKTYPNKPEFSPYAAYDKTDDQIKYKMQTNLGDQHTVTNVFEHFMYEAFEGIGLSKDYVDQNIFKKYDLTNEQQLTSLAERLVDLTLASQNALSPVERLAQIVSQFGYNTNSYYATSTLEGFKKGELTAADAFNKLTLNRYHVNQDTMDSLFTIDSANEMSTVESLLTQITSTLEAIKSNVVNIDGNTSRDSSEQIDRAISDILDIKSYYGLNGYDWTPQSLLSDTKSNVDPLNISKYRNQEMLDIARQQYDNLTKSFSYAADRDLNAAEAQIILDNFKAAWRAIDDAIQTVSLYEKRTGEQALSKDDQEVMLGTLDQMQQELFSNSTLDEALRILRSAKTQIDTERNGLLSSSQLSESSNSELESDSNGAILSSILSTLETIKSSVFNIEQNTYKGQVEQFDGVINDLLSLKDSILGQLVDYGFVMEKPLYFGSQSTIDPNNVPDANTTLDLLHKTRISVADFLADIENISHYGIADFPVDRIQSFLNDFKEAWQLLHDSTKAMDLNIDQSDDKLSDREYEKWSTHLSSLTQDLIGDDGANIDLLLQMLTHVKNKIEADRKSLLSSSESTNNQSSTMNDSQDINGLLDRIAKAVEAIQTVVQKDTGIESDGKNSVKQTEPLTDNHAEQNKLSEQELAVLGNLNEALGRLNEYLTSNLSNNTSEGAKQENSAVSNIYHLLSTKLSSQPASERTLNEIQSLIGLLLDKSKIEKDLMTAATQYSDLQSFIHDNIDALQAIGINSNEFANVLWREANYKREDFQPLEMAIEDAINVLRNQVPENILDGWFRDANSAYKPRLENLALSNKDVRNAALNVMWDNYKNYSGKDIGFKEFLYSSIPVYRGKNSEKYVDEDQVVSFTFDKSIAEKFGKHVFETMIRPIDTIGAYQTTGETEVMVRRDFLEQLPQFQTWLNNMSSGLEQSYVQAAGKPSDIQDGSDYALESTLQIVKGVLDKIAGNTEAIASKKLEGVNTNPLPPDTGADTVPDQQNGTNNAWVGTLTNIHGVLDQILKALIDGTTLSTLVQPLSDAVAALKDVSNGIIQHQKAQKSDTRVAQARIADPIQQDLIVEKAKDAVQTLGTDVQVASLDALADGIVRVSGAVKNANGIWEGFTVKVNQADEAVDLSIKKQSAFAKSLNRMDKLSGSDNEDSNPYVYDKAEVEARAKKHLDEYAAQGKKATVQFKDSGRYTITILEEIDGLSKQIFQTFDENDDKIERTTVTMSKSQKMKLDNLQKKLIDNGITNGLISDKDTDYQAYQQAFDALNNMTDAYSKMDNLSDKQIEDWKKQIKLVQQLGGQVETLIKQRKTANDAKIFESDRSKKLSRFDLDNAKLQKDINIPESFNQQIKDARTAIESAADEDALKIAINNWETLKNQIHEAAVQQDLYSEKSKNTPDQFATDLKSQKTAFNKYKRDTEDAIDVTDELKNKLIELETKLGNINDAAGLRAWQKEFKSVKDEIAATQSSYKRDKNTYSQQIMGQANAELKSAGIKKDSTNLNADQQKIIDKYNELEEQIGEYNKKVKAKQQAEISGIEQTKAALFGLIEAYKQANNIVDAKGNPSRQAYGTAQVQNFNAKYNSLQTRAQNVGLTDNFAAVQNLANAYEKLKEAQVKFKVGEDLTTDAGKAKVEAFKQAQIECNRYAAELNKVIKQEEQLSAGADYASPVNEDFDDSLSGRKKALEDFVNAIPDTAIGKFNADFTELTYTVKNGDGTFTNMTATLNAARDTIFATAGETEKATTAFGKFLNEVKGKARGILQYLMSMTGFQEIFQQIKQGAQYVREIDAALTELKKVTNETNTTYDAFLQTMSKTAGEVGSTVSELTTMAAEWARLNI